MTARSTRGPAVLALLLPLLGCQAVPPRGLEHAPLSMKPMAGPLSWVEWRTEMDTDAKTGVTSYLGAQDATYLAEGATAYLADASSHLDVRWQKLSGPPERELLRVRHDDGKARLTPLGGRTFDLLKHGPWRLDNGLILSGNMQKDGSLRVTLFNPEHPRLADFDGFRFFPFNTDAVVTARFRKSAEVVRQTYTTTRDLQSHAFRIGHVEFELGGTPIEMAAYTFDREFDPNKPVSYLAFMFKDATSGKETYGGGRYLDVELPDGLPEDELVLDFNRTQNFYCARSEHWNCPVLWEKALPVAIEAGEMAPLGGHH